MASIDSGEVTWLLKRIQAGEGEARHQLLHLIYSRLYRMAAARRRLAKRADDEQTTNLLHDALVHLLQSDVFQAAPDRRYLFAAAAQAMRQVVVDEYRRQKAAKRGGGRQQLPFSSALENFTQRRVDLEAVHEALEDLSGHQERQALAVTLQYFGNFTVAEIAAELGVSVSTAESDLRLAKAWLKDRLKEDL
jgi:RNA polymerase sigma factor (TIGR02999 family)